MLPFSVSPQSPCALVTMAACYESLHLQAAASAFAVRPVLLVLGGLAIYA